MNQYSELLNYIKQLADADPFIQTITQGSTADIDLDKGNIFSLLHVVIDGGGFTNGSTVNFNVLLQCVAIRDINNNPVKDKYMQADNEVDNHNETLASLNRLWNKMYVDFDKNDITSSENPSFTKISYDGTNVYDGWELNFTVETPNTTINLCQ